MNKNKSRKNTSLKAIDFFCGGGGMSYGMQAAGIEVLAGIDNDKNCKKTYEANIKGASFIQADVFDLKEEVLQKQLGIKEIISTIPNTITGIRGDNRYPLIELPKEIVPDIRYLYLKITTTDKVEEN